MPSRWHKAQAAAILVIMAAISCGASGAPAAPVAPRGIDWDTYGFTASRGSWNPFEATVRPDNVRHLRQAWSFKLGSVIDTQPLYAAQVVVRVKHTPLRILKDLVIAGSESGRLAAVDASDGKKVWERRLGHVDFGSCSDLPHFGITGTPVIDRGTNSVYVADGVGRVDQLNLSTGHVKRRWRLTRDPEHEHVWSALTLVNRTLYADIAGNCDIRPYHGQVVSINLRRGSIHRWFVTGASQGGGIWSWAGISADPQRHALYAATGNSFSPTEHVGYGEHVVRLTPNLRVRSSNYPGLPTGDADFGTTPALFQAPGCRRQLAVGDKFGSFFLYDRDAISRGPVQRISLFGSGRGQVALLGIAAYLPPERLLYVTNPGRNGPYRGGMLAFRVNGHCRLSLRWQTPGPGALASSPTIAGGLVFYGTGSNRKVIALDARTGKRLWASDGAIKGAVYNAPTVVNGAVYVGSWDGRIHAFKLG